MCSVKKPKQYHGVERNYLVCYKEYIVSQPNIRPVTMSRWSCIRVQLINIYFSQRLKGAIKKQEKMGVCPNKAMMTLEPSKLPCALCVAYLYELVIVLKLQTSSFSNKLPILA